MYSPLWFNFNIIRLLKEGGIILANNTNQYDAYDGKYKDTYKNVGGGSTNYAGMLTAGTIGGIFGMPYQFMDTVDRRLMFKNDSKYTTDDRMGRKYAEKIATHLPLLFINPCRQVFMEGFNSSEQEQILSDLIKGGGSGDMSKLLSKTGRYYTTSEAYAEYYNCVSLMCREVAYLCGLQKETIRLGDKTIRIDQINWQDFKNESFKTSPFTKYFNANNSVVFYADGLTTVSDSFSNNTTDSSLANSINGFSDQAKEIRFLMGGSNALTELYSNSTEALSSISSGLAEIGGDLTAGMLGDLARTGVSSVLTGGKLIFPKIWGDSNYNRSFSFSIKLRSPDHDNLSIFMNILVPFIHLLALCMPQSLTSGDSQQNPNAYNTPFMVRAYAKGMFNINMGMITDMSVTRGGEAQWNNNGLPTQMDIDISIEDLYSSLFMTNPQVKKNGTTSVLNISNAFDLVTNTEMLDYLSNLAGLNVSAKNPITRKTALLTYLIGSSFRNAPANLYNNAENFATSMLGRLYRRVLGE